MKGSLKAQSKGRCSSGPFGDVDSQDFESSWGARCGAQGLSCTLPRWTESCIQLREFMAYAETAL